MGLPALQFEKFEKEVAKQNTPLMDKAIAVLAQAQGVAVVDNDTLKAANDLKKEINAQAKTVKDLRLEFTRPIDDFKQTIIDAERSILVHLDEAKTLVADQIIRYEEKLEAERQAEAKRVQDLCDSFEVQASSMTDLEMVTATGKGVQERFTALPAVDQNNPAIKLAHTRSINALRERHATLTAEKQAEEERQRLAAQTEAQDAEQAAIDAERVRVAAEQARLEAERQALVRQQEEQRLEEARLAAEKAAAKEDKLRVKTNTTTAYDFTIDNPAILPMEYWSPDEKKIRAAIAAGTREIPGVVITERRVVR